MLGWLIAGMVLGGAIAHFVWKRRYLKCEASLLLSQEQASLLKRDHRDASQQSEAERVALFDSMIEGFLLVDADGKIETVNPALLDLFRLTGDLRGKTLMEAFRLHELLELSDQVRKRREPVRDFEIDLPTLEARRSLSVNAAPVHGENQRLESIIYTFHDTTRLKQLESTRREFVANVSHELRTPLTLIKGFVETLIDGAKNDPALVGRFLQTILKHTDRLTFLIEDLLTISKLESGQVVMNAQSMSIRPIVERVYDDLQTRAAERKISLSNNIPKDMICYGDADRLQQVIFNLVDNAIKYGCSDGNVSVNGWSTGADHVEIEVHDDGPGIPPESLERVFERFYRLDKARSREQGGTGLGLAIVKHIIHSHGGRVWAEAQANKGASFHFTLPIGR